MSAAPFMQLYVADYLGDTRHLTTEQHGAYLLLLMTMWRSEGVLPNCDKKLARIAGCTASRWTKIKAEVLEFFTVEGLTLVNKRLMLEFKKASEKSIKRAEAGTQGGHAKALKDKETPLANASVLPCHSSEPEPDTTVTTVPVVRRASRLPPEWVPDPDDLMKALDLIGPERTATELEKFRDHWRSAPGSKGVKLDWSATYRNWIRRASESKTRNEHAPRSAKSEHLDAVARAMVAACDRPEGERRGHPPHPGFEGPGGGFPAAA